MIKETITYEDYNGQTRTEDFYFHLSKAEALEMEMSVKGGLAETINRVVEAKDMPAVIKIFKELIMKSYGRKSVDGKTFEKNDDIRNEFMQSEAYSELFMKLGTDSDAAARFVNGILAGAGNGGKSQNAAINIKKAE